MTWYRRIVKALEKENLTNAQAAELVGISESAVRSLTKKTHQNITKQFIKLAFLAITIEEGTFEFFFGKTFKLPKDQAQELNDEFNIPTEEVINVVNKRPEGKYIGKNRVSVSFTLDEIGLMKSTLPSRIIVHGENGEIIRIVEKDEYASLKLIRKESFWSKDVFYVVSLELNND